MMKGITARRTGSLAFLGSARLHVLG